MSLHVTVHIFVLRIINATPYKRKQRFFLGNMAWVHFTLVNFGAHLPFAWVTEERKTYVICKCLFAPSEAKGRCGCGSQHSGSLSAVPRSDTGLFKCSSGMFEGDQGRSGWYANAHLSKGRVDDYVRELDASDS